MGMILPAVVSLFTMISSGITNWIEYKKKKQEVDQEVRLATITAQAQMATAQLDADSNEITQRLSSTSQRFKQGTFYFLTAVLAYSILLPTHAEVLWHNFTLIPQWFTILYSSILGAIWGFPMAKNMMSGIMDAVSDRRDFKIAKIEAVSKAVNDKAFYDMIRAQIFTKGITEDQLKVFQDALKARDGR